MPRLSRIYRFALMALVVGGFLSVPEAIAQDTEINPVAMSINMIGNPQFIAGSPYEVLVQIDASGVGPDNLLAAMGVLVTPPPGWEYLGTTAGPLGGPDIEPRGGSGVLEFAWINPPQQFPYEFSFTLSVPVSEEGTRFISGQGLYRTTGPELYTAPVIVTAQGADNTPPVIELVGDNPLDWPLGEPFVDPGYTATDSADGDLTSQVSVLGNVDFTSEGSYTLTYVGVTDSAGNRGANVTRQVNVIDFGDDPPDTETGSDTDDGDVLSSGGSTSGGLIGRNGNSRLRNNQKADNDNKKKRARNRRNANQNAQNAARSKTASLAQRLADQNRRNMAARNQNSPTPTQLVIPKTGGAAIGDAMREAAAAANGEGDPAATADALTPPGPRDLLEGEGYGEGEGEGAMELAALDATSPPVTQGTDADAGVLAKISTAFREMGPRQYTALGAILAVLILAIIIGAATWKSAYRRTPRRRTGTEAETDTQE